MNPDLNIKGGAGEFEAAVVAVVLDRIAREEAAARQSRGTPKTGLPAWVRVVKRAEPKNPQDIIRPDISSA
ncbi:MAG: hypothetical protein ACLFRT_03700 [Actinomycetota bacterium]